VQTSSKNDFRAWGGVGYSRSVATGTGKTYIFELLYPNLKTQAVFTVPTRALANDKLSEWRARGWDVGISTGDIALNLDAQKRFGGTDTMRTRGIRRRRHLNIQGARANRGVSSVSRAAKRERKRHALPGRGRQKSETGDSGTLFLSSGRQNLDQQIAGHSRRLPEFLVS